MPRHSGYPLHIRYPLRWNTFPLRNSLRADFIPHRTGEAAGAAGGLFSLVQGNGGRVQILLQIAHAVLKAQLSGHCKYIFR